MYLPQVEQYLDTVCARIKTRRVRAGVREEMRGHLEDHALRLMQCGLPEEAAWLRAIEEMGVPEEVAEQLGEIHTRDPLVDVKEALFCLLYGLCFFFPYWDVWAFDITATMGALLTATALWQMRRGNRRMRAAFFVYLVPCAILVARRVQQTLPAYWGGIWGGLLALFHLSNILCLALIGTGLDDLMSRRRVPHLRMVAAPYAVPALLQWFAVIHWPGTKLYAFLFSLPFYIYIFIRLYQARRRLCEDEGNLPDFRPLTGRNRAVAIVAVVAAFILPFVSAYLVKTQSPGTVPYVQADVGTDEATETQVTAIKTKLRSMGFPLAILETLPQSELLAYRNYQNIQSVSVSGTESNSLPLRLLSVCTEHADGTARWIVYYEWVAPPPADSRCQLSVYAPKGPRSRTILLAGEREILPFSDSLEFAALAGKEGQRGLLIYDLPMENPYTCSVRFAYQDSLFRMPYHQEELNEHRSNGTVQGDGVWEAEYLTQTIGGNPNDL